MTNTVSTEVPTSADASSSADVVPHVAVKLVTLVPDVVVGDRPVTVSDHATYPHLGGDHLHRAHPITATSTAAVPGMPLRARWPSTATDNDRVGIRQPLPRGRFDGPCKLRGSSGRLGPAATTAAQHLHTGAASPRHNARSSVDNPRVSGLTADSAAKVHPYRAGTEARERGEMPGLASGTTVNIRGASADSRASVKVEFATSEANTAGHGDHGRYCPASRIGAAPYP